jgi:hypothetical protein
MSDLGSSSFQSLVDELCEWMREKGLDVKSNEYLKLIVSKNKWEGRCVLAKCDIQFDQTIIDIPNQLLINYRFALENSELVELFEWSFTKYGRKLTRLEALYLYLIVQRYDDRSPLNKFVNSMPLSYDTPEYFNLNVVNCLPFYLKHDILARLENLKSNYEFLKNLITSFYESKEKKQNSYATIKILLENFNYDTFIWIFCSVNSRCFHVEEVEICKSDEIKQAQKLFKEFTVDSQLKFESLDQYSRNVELNKEIANNLCCLIPFLDFLNHSFKPNSFAYFDKENKCYTFKSCDADSNEYESPQSTSPSDSSFAIKKDEQLYIQYGFHENKTLFIDYGFILEENPFDKISFKPDDFRQFLNERDSFNSLMEHAVRAGLLSDLTCNKTDGPSWCLIKLLDLVQVFQEQSEKIKQAKSPKKLKKILNLNPEDHYEINNSEKIKILFEKLLISFRNDSVSSLNKLKSLSQPNSFNYHLEMSAKLINLTLEIIEFNLNLLSNQENWILLF